MTNTTRKIHDIEPDLRTRRAELEQQINALVADSDEAALQVAEGNTLAAKKVSTLRQQIGELRDEIAALDAAGRALGRRKEEEQKAARLKAVEQAKAAIPGAAIEVQAAWDKLAEAITEVGKAWSELKGAAVVANDYAWECQSAGAHAVGSELQNRVSTDLLSRMAGGLLWIATKDQISPDNLRFGNTSATADEVRERIVYALNKLCSDSGRHAARAAEAISA